MSEFKIGDKVLVKNDGGYAAGLEFEIEFIGDTMRGKFAEGAGARGGVFLARLTRVREGFDAVKKAEHYNSDPSGVECITIIRHRNFNIGNAIKYLWRAGLKVAGLNQTPKEKQIEDLRKAIFYIEDEIKLLEGE